MSSIKDLAVNYSLKSNDLIQLLGKAGVDIQDENVTLSDEELKAFKVYMANTERRSVLSVRAATKSPQKITVVRAKTATSVKKETQASSAVSVCPPDTSVNQKRLSDADKARSDLSVQTKKPVASRSSVSQNQKSSPSKPKSQPSESIAPAQSDRKKQRKDAKSKRQERQEIAGDLIELKRADQLLRQKFNRPSQQVIYDVSVPESITVSELANRCAVKASEVITHLFQLGMMATINQTIDQETAVYVVEALGHRVVLVKNEEALLLEAFSNDFPLKPRPPVVTVMGHVDHGKTSLLDAMRRSQIVDSESGGITQHIGAYLVDTEQGAVAFLDTPGHEAFTAMRARGAGCTDIVVLVVAADDGVMPQTIEAIQHAKAANVPLVVAINKMDKEDANPERIKTELTQHDVLAESLGGDVLFQEISAKTGMGIDHLLENLALQAEILELSAPEEGSAAGLVIESILDKGLGPVTTLLVQAGCLNQGDIVLTGKEYGRVRVMADSHGQYIDSAGPSVPVKITGLSGVPFAGDVFRVVETERVAREYAHHHKNKIRDKRLSQATPKPLEQMFLEAQSDQLPSILSIVIKADTQGSVEAISESVKALGSDQIQIQVMSAGVGQISESDVNLAQTSSALLVGFNVRADGQATQLMQMRQIEPFYCSVIYDLIDRVKSEVEGLEKPVYSDKILGIAEVREVFRSSRFGVASGCMVLEGVLQRNAKIRVLREGIVIHQGVLNSVRRQKEDVNEVKTGVECGLGIKDYTDVKPGDRIEAFMRQAS